MPPLPARARLLRFMVYAILIFSGSYAVLCVAVFFLQDRMLYAAKVVPPEEVPALAQRQRLTPYIAATAWDNVAWTWTPAAAPAQPTRGTIIVAHGNRGFALASTGFCEALTPLGFRVILYEYPGYGSNPGSPSEAGNVEPLRRLVREVAASSGQGPVYLFGQSMGCGVVCSALADKTLPVTGVILLQPWDTLAGVGAAHYPFLPVRFMVGDKYNSVANLQHFAGPVAFVICGSDRTILPALSRHLYDSYPGKKLWIEHPGLDHHTWPSKPGLPWWKSVTDFVAPPPSS